MLNYFIRRFLLIIPTFLGCTLVVFFIMQMTPGGPYEQILLSFKQQAMDGGEGGGGGGAGQEVTEASEDAKRELQRYFDLDKPIHVRYVKWLGNVLSGDFGESYFFSEPVLDVITSRFPISIYFGLIGFILSYLVCIPLGIYKAVRHGSSFDFLSSAIVFIGYSVPGWTVGAVLLVLLGGQLQLVPLGGFRSADWEMLTWWGKIVDQLHHTLLPIFAYMVGSFATLTILMKNSLMENLGQDYVRTAFAKGLTERRVIVVHALRNSMIPIATGLGHSLTLVLAGSYLIEKAFDIHGMGMLGYVAAMKRDYMVMMGILVISVTLQLIGNILSDLLYALVDPRIRFK